MPLLQSLFENNEPKIDSQNSPRPEYPSNYGDPTIAGERVSVRSSMSIATFYRGLNIITDDIAKMPFQQFQNVGGKIEKVEPDPKARNMAYLMQVSPNDWGWTPFQLKKAFQSWKILYGIACIWRPPVSPQQLFILPSNRTKPVYDFQGNLWFEHRFPSAPKPVYIPGVEVFYDLINPDETGVMGRGVIAFARETIGQRLGARKTQSKLYSQGLTAAAYVQVDADLDADGRKLIKNQYAEAMSGSENAYGLAVLDRKITKFEAINIDPKDAQFLESIEANDVDIANFLGMPLHMLNNGKQAYNSNEQKYTEYLQGTLDAHLVPFEERARISWLDEKEQQTNYFKFNRASLLRMDAKSRADTNSVKIQSGQMTPNEARALEEQSPIEGGDEAWMMTNVQPMKRSLEGNANDNQS